METVSRQVAVLLHDVILSIKLVDEFRSRPTMTFQELQQEIRQRVKVGPYARKQVVHASLLLAKVGAQGTGRDHREVPVANLSANWSSGIVTTRAEEDVDVVQLVEIERLVYRL